MLRKTMTLQTGRRAGESIRNGLLRWGPMQLTALHLNTQISNEATRRGITSSIEVEARAFEDAMPFEEMPLVTPLMMLKCMMAERKGSYVNLTKVFTRLKQQMGDVMLIRGIFGQQDMVMTHNPNDFEKMFRSEGTWPNRPGIETLKYHRHVRRKDFFQGVEGVITTDGEQWGSFRSKVNAVLLKPENVRLYLHKMSQVNSDFIKRIRVLRDPATLEVPGAAFEREINRWTLESVSVVALDRRLHLLDGQTEDNSRTEGLFQAMRDFFQYSVMLEFFPSLWRYIPTYAYYRTMKALDTITDTGFHFVNEAVNRIEQRPPKDIAEKGILEKLLSIDKKVAIVMAMDLLLAGVDTTSSTFFGLLLCMAQHPEKQSKLRQEVRTILPHKDSEFEKDSLEKMPFLRACIKESLRLYPLTNGNARIIQRDVILSGYRVPQGTPVFTFAPSLMRDESLYPQANTFVPERWLRTESSRDSSDPNHHPSKSNYPFVYLPFGFGVRSCIGRRIVEMELQLGLARLIRNFHVEYPHPIENPYKSLLINVPNIPLNFRFKEVD